MRAEQMKLRPSSRDERPRIPPESFLRFDVTIIQQIDCNSLFGSPRVTDQAETAIEKIFFISCRASRSDARAAILCGALHCGARCRALPRARARARLRPWR